MSSKFVPLQPGSLPRGPSAGFVPKVLPPPGSEPSATLHSAAHPAAAHGQPVVELRKEGDLIKGIVVKCPCGQVIELDCLY
jgi:hypothetical protein